LTHEEFSQAYQKKAYRHQDLLPKGIDGFIARDEFAQALAAMQLIVAIMDGQTLSIKKRNSVR
jgi:hypothetical protein